MNQPQAKTILAWFEEAREAGHEWADAAIENAWAANSAKFSGKKQNLAHVLESAFVWDETTQGFKFWDAVHNSLRRNP